MAQGEKKVCGMTFCPQWQGARNCLIILECNIFIGSMKVHLHFDARRGRLAVAYKAISGVREGGRKEVDEAKKESVRLPVTSFTVLLRKNCKNIPDARTMN